MPPEHREPKTENPVLPAFPPLLWILALVGFVAAVAYARSFPLPFAFDDVSRIVGNPVLDDPWAVGAIWRFWETRFLCFWSLAWNVHFGGHDPSGFHLMNLALHAATAMAVAALAWTVAGWDAGSGFSVLGSRCGAIQNPKSKIQNRQACAGLMAGIVFAVHPLQSQAVLYLTQRGVLIATLGLVSAAALYAAARVRWESQLDASLSVESLRPERAGRAYRLFCLAWLAGVLAQLGKEFAVILPGLIAVVEWTGLRRSALRRRTRLGLMALFALPALIIPLLMQFGSSPEYFGGAGLERRGVDVSASALPMGQYFLTELGVILRYLGLFLLPVGQSLMHDVQVSPGLAHGPTLARLAAIVLLLAGTWVVARRWPLIGFGLAWWWVALLPESSIVPIRDLMFEHRTYLPNAGLALAAAGAVAYAFQRRSSGTRLMGYAMLLAAACLGIWATWTRCDVWASPVTLWREAAQRAPTRPVTHNNLGMALVKDGQPTEAEQVFREAVRLSPYYAEALFNLGAVLATQGKLDEARMRLAQGLTVKPGSAPGHCTLANVLMQQDKLDEAVQHFRWAVQFQPTYAAAHHNLAHALVRQGKPEQAVTHYHAALSALVQEPSRRGAPAVSPLEVETRINLAIVLQGLKAHADAIQALRDGVSRAPQDSRMALMLARLLASCPVDALRNGAEALRLAQRVCAAGGEAQASPLDALAAAYAELGRFDEAVATARRALQAASAQGSAHLAD
ncbi:MAG: tetratricopeptide repeat protein, partial [Planctomycetes bacterium]|nr:tetratricopeptide repeat protein [Planctomycetota bacterium]